MVNSALISMVGRDIVRLELSSRASQIVYRLVQLYACSDMFVFTHYATTAALSTPANAAFPRELKY